jgi:glycosyltransferase involved in cell wall biosynthesis
MVLGIDATNIRTGGGLTHLQEILNKAVMSNHDISQVIVWASLSTLNALPSKEWLIKETHPLLNKSFVFSFFYQMFFISRVARKKYKCDLLFVPGSSFLGSFKKTVALSQNMLPFEKNESDRFPKWQSRLRFKLLNHTQKYTFKRAKAVIFLTNYAKDYISKSINLPKDSTIIPHGINLDFASPPRPQSSLSEYSIQKPFRLLYVSIVTVYKHQWNVAEAILRLRTEGYPIELDLVGGYNTESLNHLNRVLENDKEGVVHYKGLIPYEQLGSVYKSADGFIFASSCENMPIILIEAMTAGLPVASSNMGPMPEVLGDDAFYFNPLKSLEIYTAVKSMLDSKELRKLKANNSYNKSINYTWQSCSHKTFEYLSHIAKQN